VGVTEAISGSSPSDVWAVGKIVNGATRPLIDHFNGATWTQVKSPAVTGEDLAAVAALSPTDAWAMSADGELAEAWNGTAWTTVPTAPNLPAGFQMGNTGQFGGPDMSGVVGGPLFAVGDNGILEQPHP
jgi:hypothetical protein